MIADKFQFVEQMNTAASVMEAAVLLCTDVDCIRNGDLMAVCDAVCSVECKGSYGTAFFDHLAADRAGFTGSQIAVVTVLQVYANLGCSLHLELVHCLTGLRNIDLVIVLHNVSLLFVFAHFTEPLSSESPALPEESTFLS